MRFGTGKDIITPAAPTYLACSGVFDKPFTWVHDDVYVRCLVLDDGQKKAVFMAFDLLFHERLLNDRIAAYASKTYGIDSAAVVVSYSHAHTAPAAKGYNLGHHDDIYEEMLLNRAITCLDRAMCSMVEGSLEYATFDADFNVSRRGIKDGVFRICPSLTYPKDREFWVFCLKDLEGNLRSIVTNYACHPVFYPTKDGISAEFPGRLCQLLDAKFYGCTSLFFQSAAGDVRPRGTLDEEKMEFRNDTDFGDVEAMAQGMFQAVCQLIDGGKFQKAELALAADAFMVELPIDGNPPSYFEEKMRAMENDRDNPDRVSAFYIAQGGYDTLADSLHLHCQTLRLTEDLYVTTVGGEPCFGVKNAIKKAFGDKQVCFIGYTDSCAYIVSDRMIAEGGYEPNAYLEYCLKGPFKPGVDKLYADGFTKSLKRL